MSYSRLAMRLTRGRERLLAALGVRSRSVSDMQLGKALAHARGAAPQPPAKSVTLSWGRLMRMLSRYGPQDRYALPTDLYLGRHQARNTAFYTALRAVSGGYLHLRGGRSDVLDLASFRCSAQQPTDHA